MFKVKIFTVGKTREPWLQAALAEYEKRLSAYAKIQWMLAKNSDELAAKAMQESPWIALDVRGELVDSPRASQKLLKIGARWNFVIGDAEGLPSPLLEKSAWRWSLSPLTFTHQMTRLVLLEQIYRALEINAGSSYHK